VRRAQHREVGPPRAHPQTATTAHGRRIAFDVHGDPNGPPIIYLHGVPSGRLEVHVFGLPEAAQRAGVQLVAIDRPGVGATSPGATSSFAVVSSDIAAVADSLGHERFGLVGYSGGSAFALNTATVIPKRVTGLGLISGVAPGDLPDLAVGRSPEVARMFRWARSRPRRLRTALRAMRWATRHPDMLVRAAADGAPPPDQEVLAHPAASGHFADFLADAMQHGVNGVAADFALAAGPWGSQVTHVEPPTLIWHGEQDLNAPVEGARWLHAQIPGSRLHTYRDEGHASLITNHGADMLAKLASM
jgi:pimeloyl-ACP methyl ester carboxylesterase